MSVQHDASLQRVYLHFDLEALVLLFDSLGVPLLSRREKKNMLHRLYIWSNNILFLLQYTVE